MYQKYPCTLLAGHRTAESPIGPLKSQRLWCSSSSFRGPVLACQIFPPSPSTVPLSQQPPDTHNRVPPSSIPILVLPPRPPPPSAPWISSSSCCRLHCSCVIFFHSSPTSHSSAFRDHLSLRPETTTNQGIVLNSLPIVTVILILRPLLQEPSPLITHRSVVLVDLSGAFCRLARPLDH